MEPEQKAREEIDRQLIACGWLIQDHKAMNLGAGPGIAVREFPLETGPVDYLLYAGGKVIGVIEAKPEGHALKGVEIQSAPSRGSWFRKTRRMSRRASCWRGFGR